MLIRLLLAGVLAFGASILRAQTLAATSPGPADFAGLWLGEVVAPNDRTTIGFEFTPGDQGLITTFHMPAMFLARATIGPAQIANGALRVRPLDTTLVRDGDKLTGTFGLSHLPVELRRAGKFPDAKPAPTYPPAPAPRWTAALGAETWASPTAADDAIFIGSVAGKFHALDAATGRVRWTWSGPNPLYGTALVTDRRIYLVDDRSNLVALARDGTLAWRLPLHDEKLGGPLKPNETFTHRTPTPVLVAGTLYVGSSDGGVYAIDPAAGKVLWRHETNTRIYATLGVDGDDLLVGGFDGTVLVLNRDTKKETARKKLPGPVVSTPVVVQGTVIVGCRDYMLYGLNRADLAGKWQYSFWFSWVESTPAVVDGVVYLGGSDFARVSALEPEEAEAEWATVVHGLTWGTPLVTSDAVFAGTHAQANAIIPHEAGFVALDRETGAVKWRHVIPLAKDATRAGFLGSPTLVGGNVIAVAFDGTVTAWPAN